MNEDEIIIESFKVLRQSIVDGDWNLVCKAYEMISGEKLEPKVPEKTRLEKIREGLKTDNTVEKSSKSPSKKTAKKN